MLGCVPCQIQRSVAPELRRHSLSLSQTPGSRPRYHRATPPAMTSQLRALDSVASAHVLGRPVVNKELQLDFRKIPVSFFSGHSKPVEQSLKWSRKCSHSVYSGTKTQCCLLRSFKNSSEWETEADHLVILRRGHFLRNRQQT